MDKESIKHAIMRRACSEGYSFWTIGLTHDPAGRKQEHRSRGESVVRWAQWAADSLSDAQEIETYFVRRRGMTGGHAGDLNPYLDVYVYIY